jgi:hypothetical protein
MNVLLKRLTDIIDPADRKGLVIAFAHAQLVHGMRATGQLPGPEEITKAFDMAGRCADEFLKLAETLKP